MSAEAVDYSDSFEQMSQLSVDVSQTEGMDFDKIDTKDSADQRESPQKKSNMMEAEKEADMRPMRPSFKELKEDDKLSAAYSLLDRSADEAKGVVDLGTAEEKGSDPHSPARGMSKQAEAKEAQVYAAPDPGTDPLPLRELGSPNSRAAAPSSPIQSQSPMAPPAISHGGASPIRHSPPAAAAQASQVSSSVPLPNYKAAAPRPAAGSGGMGLQRNSLEFALTQQPFMDMGLRYAMYNVDRITGGGSAQQQAGGGSHMGSTLSDARNTAAMNESLLDAVAGGSSYFKGSRGPKPAQGSAVSRASVSMSASVDRWPPSKQEKTQARAVAEADEARRLREEQERQLQAEGMDYLQQAVPPPQHSQQRQSPQGQTSPPKPDPLASKQRKSKDKAERNIAGFVSEPWRKSPGSPGTETIGGTMALAANLIGTVKSGGFDQGQGYGLGQAIASNDLNTALQEQAKNRHTEALGALVPAAATLINKKVLAPVKSASTAKRASNSLRRANKGSSSGRNIVSTSEFAVAECLELAATQAELQNALQKQIKEQLLAARSAVQEKLRIDRGTEARLETKVIELAEKTAEAKKRIKIMQSSKGENIAAKESDKAAFREEMLRVQTEERAARAEEKRLAAGERKKLIASTFKEKSRAMEETVMSKLALSKTAIQAKLDAQRAAHEEKAVAREQKILEKIQYAAEIEKKVTAERAEVLESKDTRFERTIAMQEEEMEEVVNRRKVKDTVLSFRAEQRRMMLDAKRQAEMELGRIRQTQEAVLAATRRKTDAQRPIKLHAIYADQLKKQHLENGGEEEALPTPGPGDYFKNITKKIAPGGGYMASSRPESQVSDVPGPGHYSNEEVTKAGSGCVPFQGRGKTDVDITQLRASKLPGVGQYEVSKKSKSGRSVKLTSKGTTQLDRIIDNAKRLPGPGDYNLSNDATHKPGSMEAYLLGESDTMF